MVPSCIWKACLGALICLCILAGPAQGSAQQFTQYLSVDCSNPSAQYPTISSALAAATDGTSIFVPSGSNCTENVTVGYFKNIAIVTDWQMTFTLTGSLTIQSSHTVEIQGMVVTNSSGNGITVNNSTDVTLTFVQSVNSSGTGLSVGTSDVTIAGAGAFSNNGNIGINAGSNSFLAISAWAPGGTVDISNNVNVGINVDRSVMFGLGSMTINNTHAVSGATTPSGFGIAEYGGGKAGLFAIFGPISMASNEGGGISLWESSEMSTGGNVSWAPYLVTIQGNGPVGIAATYGDSLTLLGGITISDHSTAGISLYGNSQAAIFNSNQITHNATGTDPERAGIVVDNGSQVDVDGTSIQNNGGPGILGLMHATLDVEGSTFSSNHGGAIVCDQSTALEADLPHSVLGPANACTVSAPGHHHQHGADNVSRSLPNWQSQKARSIHVYQMSARHHPAAAPMMK